MPRINSIEMGELTDTTYYILLALLEPKHGYLIMKFIDALTDNQFSIGPASLYTVLKKLQMANLITTWEKENHVDNKKTYIITKEGEELLKQEVQRRKSMVKHAELIFEERGEIL